MGLSLRARKIHLVHLVTQEMIKHLLVTPPYSSLALPPRQNIVWHINYPSVLNWFYIVYTD